MALHVAICLLEALAVASHGEGLAIVPVLVFDVAVGLDVPRWVLAGFVAVAGYSVARSPGASRFGSVLDGRAVTVVAIAIVIATNALSGH